MKDAYSADRDQAGLDASYEAQYGAYVRIFERLGLETVVVASDVGIMGGSQAHEFMVLNPAGEDVLVLCEACDYAANRQVAVMPKPEAAPARSPLPLEEVATPGTTTIATLAAFLGIGAERTAKAAFFVTGDGRLVTAIVRGDYEVNETKLGNAVKAVGGIRPATVEEIKAAGMEPGYGSPIGAHDTVVVVDDLVARSPNLVAGANREGFHYRNVNAGRDFTADVVADITNAQEGDACPICGEPVILRNGIEVGNIFKLGTKFTDAAGATYLGEDGQSPTRSSWARTASASGATWPASSRPTTTTRGSSGRPRSRRTPRTSSRSAATKEPRVDRDRRAPPPARARRRSRDPVGRPRRVAGRQVHRCRAARHALDPDRQPALAGGRRRRGHRACDGRAVDAPDRGRRGAAQRRLMSSGTSFARALRTSASCSWLRLVPSSEMTASPPSARSADELRRATPSSRSRPRPCRPSG